MDNLRAELGSPTVAHARIRKRERRLEAPPGFEPGVEVLWLAELPHKLRHNAHLLSNCHDVVVPSGGPKVAQ